MVPGSVINRFAYTPYGESQTLTASWATPPAGSTPAVPWSHLFQGLEFTDVTALAYVRHRDYSATLGRFIELDPIGFDAGDNNWYRFVANGPTEHTDPWGLSKGQWHHMIPQKFRDIFENWGVTIDAAEFGRIMTAQDHSRLHAAKVGGRNYLAYWGKFVADHAKRKPTQAQLDTFLNTIEKDFADHLKKAHKTSLSFQEWGDYSTKLKDDILKAKRNPGSRVCVMLRRAGVVFTVGTIVYNASEGGIVFAAEEAAKEVAFYDDLDPLLKYAAHSASSGIVRVLTRRPEGNFDVYRCRCLQCRKLPDNCRCEGGPLRP
jgi:RHS repeat-associated protein